jgi:hypothetical protein
MVVWPPADGGAAPVEGQVKCGHYVGLAVQVRQRLPERFLRRRYGEARVDLRGALELGHASPGIREVRGFRSVAEILTAR